MALVIVHVAGCPSVEVRSYQSRPSWSLVVARLEAKHGPGTLEDAEGIELLHISSSTGGPAPPGEYTWTKSAGQDPRCHGSHMTSACAQG